MDCGTFLEGYSDYRDDLLPLPARVGFEAHLRACASCARYDRVVEGGVRVLAADAGLEVSEDFMDRLQHRLYHVEDELAAARRRRARPLRRSVAAAAGVAATAAGVVAGSAVYSRTAPTVTLLPAVAVSAPAPPAPGPVRVGAEAESLSARLEEVGVQVLPIPYRQVVHHSASRVALASYAPGE